MKLTNLQEQGKSLINHVVKAVRSRSNNTIDKAVNTTQEKAADITEEAIKLAVDQVINVIETVGKQVRSREIPTENISLEVSADIIGVIKLTMRANIPKSSEVKEIIVDVNDNCQIPDSLAQNTINEQLTTNN